MSISDSKRIAKNSLYLYIRLGIGLIVSLYTSRIILEALGVVDLGIYNVIGSITSMFTWLSASLSNATQRYLNFELGKNNHKRLKQVFQQSLVIFSFFAIIAAVIVIIGGLWLIDYKLNIPSDRIEASRWVLFSTAVTMAITLIGSVFDAVLIAHENMKIYAYVGLSDVFLKLLIVFLLLIVPGDRLIWYAVMLMLLMSISRFIPIVYTVKKYEECKIKFIWEKSLLKEMAGFTGWNIVGIIVFILNNQGLDILMNIFFGPVVNAAKSVSSQVQHAVTNLSSGFYTAVRPQLIKSYAMGDNEYLYSIIFNTSKYLLFIIGAFSLPIILRIDNILNIWLTVIPQGTSQFITWILLFVLVNSLSDPLSTTVQATGKQKKYILCGNSIYILVFPLAYFAFKLGFPPVTAFKILVFVRAAYIAVILYITNGYVKFGINNYIKRVILPAIIVAAVSIPASFIIDLFLPKNTLGLISFGLLSLVATAISIYFLGLRSNERVVISNKIIQLCHR